MKKSVFNTAHQNADLSSKIVAGLERVSEAFRVLLWNHAKALGISPIQIQILIFIQYHEKKLCNVSSLAKEFNVTKATISDAIRVLNNKGLIEKIVSSSDKRAYSIFLSTEGEKMVKQTEHFAKPIKTLVDRFSETTKVEIFSFLGELILNLHQAEVISVQRTCYLCRHYKKQNGSHYCNLLELQLTADQIRIDCPEFAQDEK